MKMEYAFYTEQTYTSSGVVEARVLTAAEAAELGYEDGMAFQGQNGKVFIDGFSSEKSACHWLSDLHNCEVLN